MANYTVEAEYDRDERLRLLAVRPCKWEVNARGKWQAVRQVVFAVGEHNLPGIVVVQEPSGRREAIDIYTAINQRTTKSES